MRSTIAPEISAAVMIANVPWKHMNSTCGMRRPVGSSPTPRRNSREVSPIQLLPGGERQRVADDRPQHAHESERDEAHHHRVERVLRADQPAVEERERGRHQQHERRRDQHPCSVGLVHILTSKRTKRMKATALRLTGRAARTSNADPNHVLSRTAPYRPTHRREPGGGVSGQKRRPLVPPSARVFSNPTFLFRTNFARTSLSGDRSRSCPVRRCGCCSRVDRQHEHAPVADLSGPRRA